MTESQLRGDALGAVLKSVTAGSARLAAVLRDVDRSTANRADVGDWTVSQTMAHVIGTVRLYRRMLTGWASPLQAGGLPTLNAGYFAGLIEDHPDVLADLLEEAVEAYAAEALGVGPDSMCSFHYGLPIDVVTLTAFLGNESLMHGWDVSRAVGAAFRDDQAALPVLDVLIPVLAPLVDPVALRLIGRAALHPENGITHGYELAHLGTTYITDGVGGDFDCAVEGPAFDVLLWRGGRKSAGLRTSGERPELAAAFVFPF